MWNICVLLCKCKMVQLLQKMVHQFLKNLKIKLPHDPALPLLGMYAKELKARPQTNISILTVTAPF